MLAEGDGVGWLPPLLADLAVWLVEALRWWVLTASANVRSLATWTGALAPSLGNLAVAAYWLSVWASWAMFLRYWRRTTRAYGIREAVDLGDRAALLGRWSAFVVRAQTRVRVGGAVFGLTVSAGVLVALVLAGILGTWLLLVAVGWPCLVLYRELRRRQLAGL